jgi:hypothetical protein
MLKNAALALLLLAAPAFAAGRSSVRVVVDPRVELLGVVQYLAGLRAPTPRPLSTDFPGLEARFGSFREHPAVKEFAAAAARRGGRDSFDMAMMYLSDLPELRWKRDRRLARAFVDDAGGPARMERFLADLRDFSERSRFLDFYAENRATFARYEESARAELGGRDYAGMIGAELGAEPAFRFTIVVPAIYTPGFCCYIIPYPYAGPRLPPARPRDGTFDVVTVVRQQAAGVRAPLFGLGDPPGTGLLNEPLHLFVDAAYARHEGAFAARSRLLAAFGGDCFDSWMGCANHLIVSALAARLERRVFGQEPRWPAGPTGAAEKALSARLEEYETDRNRYRSLDDFVPRLLDALDEIPAPPIRPEILLDPRVELASALHILASSGADIPGFRDDGGPYARALMKGLRGKDYPAAAAYALAARRPAPGGQAFMTPLRELVLCLDDSLALRTEPAECRDSGLAHAAADFARETGFAARIPALSKMIRPALEVLKRGRDSADLTGFYEDYAGVKVRSQRVAPSPLLEKGRAWNGIERPSSGTYWVVTAISPVSVSTAGPVFDWRPVMRDVWHEHSHGILDPAEDALLPVVEASAGLFTGKAAAECYGSWRQCVREHLAQGVSLRLIGWTRETGRLERAADATVNPHLPWEPLIVERLKEYEADRGRYPTLTSFVPRLVAVFTEEAERRGLKPAAAAASPAARAADPDVERGMALFAAGKAGEAADAFEAAVLRSSGPATNYLSLYVALKAAGRGAEAAKALDAAVESARSDPKLAPDVLSDALSSRASLRAEKGDAAGARKDLEEALAFAPENWPRRADAGRRLDALR